MKHWHETREVLDRLSELRQAGVRAALATVVRVRGSAYRHEGAKLLVAEDGSTVGNVSGGCLEQDVREVALQVLRSGTPELRNYCSSTDEVAAWDLGVGCEGQVDVFVEPALEARPRERALLEGRAPFVSCTVIRPVINAVIRPGKGEGGRLVVTRDAIEGDLGSADLNRVAAARARELLGTEESGVQGIAGRDVFCDVFLPPPQLVICGAGEDARPLARFAADVGFRVAIVDRRPAYLTAERFPSAAALIESRPEELVGRLALDDNCYAVVMTHNFADDLGYLRALRGTPVSYIGMLGPRQRTDRMLQAAGAEGALDEHDAARIYGPVGLDIGTDGAEQVALSVIAEILTIRSGRRAQSLRERQAPIHAPAD
jgi:xanthine dehydrogenase accessory factor